MGTVVDDGIHGDDTADIPDCLDRDAREIVADVLREVFL